VIGVGRALANPRAHDEALKPEVIGVYEANRFVYGLRKVWRQLKREGITVAHCTVERLTRAPGLQGVARSKARKTTFPYLSAPRLVDLVAQISGPGTFASSPRARARIPSSKACSHDVGSDRIASWKFGNSSA